jgi:hypothetical protein
MMKPHGVGMTTRFGALLIAVVCSTGTAHAAVLCARARNDGTLGGTVRIREVCRSREVQLAPEDVGFCCEASSTTSTTGAAPTSTTPTSSAPTTSGPTTSTPTTTTPSTTTVAAHCGNNVVEAGEACDCGIPPCGPSGANNGPPNRGGCPIQSDGVWTFCAQDCSACQPGPRCGDGVVQPGDACDYYAGNVNDNCAPGSVCFDTVPCECSCANAGGICIHGTSCCAGLTCNNGVCQ